LGIYIGSVYKGFGDFWFVVGVDKVLEGGWVSRLRAPGKGNADPFGMTNKEEERGDGDAAWLTCSGRLDIS
jgi:hypothetical protein